ncbi:type VI secretion system tip protein VgrG [uncultured Algibacter sp.]|uniref:type VI secretion system tip protein VgrG n=1 Tax=uncultured Algibacter sp. TaxID=298659 RepID=UPI0030EF64E6|tara:strand:+ start:5152 stop:6915 length:1764 start_codon:yes stop_codon:yes gene_type:complete
MSESSSDLLSVQLTVNGKVSNAMIIKINVIQSINKIAKATIVLNDGSKSKEDFKLSDSSEYNPGNKIEIKAGYHSKEKTIFKGLIMSQAISIDAEEGPSLIIECKDEAFVTTNVHKNNYFLNSTDSEIINKILGNYSVSKSVDSTKVKYEEVIQFGTTDWDFIVTRAEINGLVTLTDDGKISIKKPDLSGKSVLVLNYGDNIIEMDIAVGSQEQFESVEAISWDASSQKLIEGKSQEPSVNNQGSITGKKLANVLGANELLQSTIPLEKEALDSWANAQLLKSRLSRFQGTILCEGNADVKPNTLIELKGIGKKINGNAYVSSVSHDLYEGRWITEITVGIQKNWFAQEVPVNALKAAGRIPAMNGLQIGIVKKTYDDPAGEFRVQVTLPLIKDSDEGIWARLSTFYASIGFGNFFYPEVGDEVILGFLDDNPSAPIILGSVYSKKNIPTLTPDEKNTHKAITTRNLMTIDFDEEKKVITIKTPGKNIITLSDEDKGITLTDQNNNMVHLSDYGITIDSKKDIVIKAANNISVSAVNIAVKANSNLDLSANNITEKANMAFSAQAGASAELKASGNVTVKGAMVSIN